MQAILITAYKNYEHLLKLVGFFDENFAIYIHIDKKSTITSQQITSLLAKPRVLLVSQTYTVNWGGINHLLAIIELAQAALGNEDNSYFHLITGHDYPAKSLAQIIDFAQTNKDKSFMEYHPIPYSAWPENGVDRLSRYNMYDLIDARKGMGERLVKGFSKIQKAIGFTRSFANDFPPQYGGSSYWSLSREAMEYVFKYIEQHPKYLKRFRYSFCSEEIFFQTILLNSPLKNKIVNDNLRFILWEERNGNFPANLDTSDYKSIMTSNALFARKFEYPTSQSLLEKMINE